jgi:hypothetical protein
MPGDKLPEILRHFLESSIDSVEQLRVLLLLRSDLNRQWTIEEITAEMRSSTSSIQKRLDDLYARGVLVHLPESGERHSYRPANDQLRDVITLLAEVDLVRPYCVIDAIYSNPTKSLKAFSDAFRLRRDKS